MIEQEIVKAGLLGTDKYMPQPAPALAAIGARIAQQEGSKEDQFLKLAALTLLYREAGAVPQEITTLLPPCPEETARLVNDKIAGLLERAIRDKEEVLLQYLVFRCNQKNEVAPPELAPLLLDKACDRRKHAPALVKVCGAAGPWLCALNEDWKGLIGAAVQEEDVWETGSLERRQQYLYTLRQRDPQAALQLLEAAIGQENASGRLALLEALQVNLSLQDESFLEQLRKDKSQKVKELALSLLQQLQGSAVNKSYLAHVLKVICIKEERHLLISKKKVLTIDDSLLPEETIFTTGITKVSSEKGMSDSLYILGQMMACIDPAVLAGALHSTEQELIALLLQQKQVPALLPYLTESAVRFRNKTWTLSLLREQVSDIRMLDILSPAERTGFYNQFLGGQYVGPLLNYLLDDQYTTLSPGLASDLLEHLSRQPYEIQQPDYQRLALHLPLEAATILKTYGDHPGDDYQARYFKAQAMEMLRYIDFKNLIS